MVQLNPRVVILLVVMTIGLLSVLVEYLTADADDELEELLRYAKEIQRKKYEKDSAERNRMLLAAAAAPQIDAAEITKLLTLRGVDPNYHSPSGGVLFLLLDRPRETSEMIDAVSAVLRHPRTNPNGVGQTWPPLKVAIAKGHRRCIDLLVDHPRTKKEISAKGLRCVHIPHIPRSVTVVAAEDDEDCFKSLPSARTIERGAALVDAKTSFTATRSLLYDVHSYVYDPSGFEDIYAAALTYFVGPVFFSPVVTMTALSMLIFCFLLWIRELAKAKHR
jgi:hypothetical protein